MQPFTTIKILGDTYTLRQSLRAMMYFEEHTGRQVAEAKGLSDLVTMFFFTLLCCNREIWKMDIEEFTDTLDRYPELLAEYSAFLEKANGKTEADTEKKKDFG